jgi:hypothetical protein
MTIDYIRAFQRVNNGLSDTTPPFKRSVAVALTQPASGQTVAPNTMITLAATPSNAATVNLYANGTKICQVINSPYKCNYTTPASASNVKISAVAISSSGVSATTSRYITVAPPSGSPSVKILQPYSGQKIKPLTWTTLSATGSNLVKVEWLVNNKLFCTDTTAPYNCSYRTPSYETTVDLKANGYSSSGAKVQAHRSFYVRK